MHSGTYPVRAVPRSTPIGETAAESPRQVIPPDDYIVELTDAAVWPRQVLSLRGGLLPDTFRRRNPRHAHVGLDRLSEGALASSSTGSLPRLRGRFYYLDGEHADHFGHMLLEVTSRLWGLGEIGDLDDVTVLSYTKRPEAITAMLEPFGLGADRIVIPPGPCIVERLLVASQSYYLEQSASPRAAEVWNRIGRHYDRGETPSRIYVTRAHWGKQRILTNEREVEALFERRGFTIVAPETLSIPDQVNLFRNASVIAGPSGSAMYNCVFARPGTRVVILISSRFITPNDALIADRTGADVSYIAGEPAEGDQRKGMFADWSLDLDKTSTQLKAIGI